MLDKMRRVEARIWRQTTEMKKKILAIQHGKAEPFNGSGQTCSLSTRRPSGKDFLKMQNSSFHCMTLKEDLRRDDEGYAFLKKTRMIINPGEDAMHQM